MSLAMNVKLEAFDKVKKTMDEMLAKLKTQQQNEVEQSEMCKKNVDEIDNSIKKISQ